MVGGDLPPPPPVPCEWPASCAQYNVDNIADFIEAEQATQSIVLMLHTCDDELAHAAVRHMQRIALHEHSVYVCVSPAQRKHPAFTPWLRDCKTQSRQARKQAPIVMRLQAQQRHVHSESGTAPHAASFDLRVGGRSCRALIDTGATLSVMHIGLTKLLGTPVQPAAQRVVGLGGSVSCLGQVTVPVKLGKVHVDHQFSVLDKPAAGYDVLLGQDFLMANHGHLRYSPTHITFSLGEGQGSTSITRPIADSVAIAVADRHAYAAAAAPAPEGTEMSHKEYKRVMQQAARGRQIVYRVCLVDVNKPAPVNADAKAKGASPEVQAVINKHSAAGGTLCGDIPVGVATAPDFNMKIHLVEGANPIHVRQYRLTPVEREELIKKVSEFLSRGWIEPSNSAWSASVVFAPKPNGKLRFCVDYRRLNDVTVKDAGPIPLISDTLDSLRGACVYSALDLCSGYYQIPLDVASRAYTAFPAPDGLYQWTVMPMGLSNAPAVFQAAMNKVLAKHIRAGYCRVYLDDVLVMSTSVAEHAKHLDAVLSALRDAKLFCQLPKCQFELSELKYLGHIVNGQGVKPDPSKVAALDRFQVPSAFLSELKSADSEARIRRLRTAICKAARQFLGFMNYFARFIPRFADLAGCLYDQIKDDAPPWTQQCTDAWEAMKVCLKRATLMWHPDPAKEFHVYFDASLLGVGGCLMQYHEELLRPVAYCARKLKPAEVNYTTTEQEMLAMYFCLNSWRCYLEGPRIVMHTDHEPLTWLASQKTLNRRQCRWMEFFSRFNWDLLYVKGDKNVVADALSRLLDLPDEPAQPIPGESWPAHVVALCRHASRGCCALLSDGSSEHRGPVAAPSSATASAAAQGVPSLGPRTVCVAIARTSGTPSTTTAARAVPSSTTALACGPSSGNGAGRHGQLPHLEDGRPSGADEPRGN